jgi:DNA-binding response OmpR family regulator
MRFAKRRVLCVDDHQDTCELLRFCFSEWDVVTASSATEAVRIAKRGIFDLYVLDTRLPDENGVELCRRIRRFDSHTPILFYSAAAYPEDRIEAVKAGASDYIAKPADPDSLRRCAESLIRKAVLRDLEARSIELEALSENSLTRSKDLHERSRQLFARSMAARVRAYKTFSGAGGTRATFVRFWARPR